MSDADGDGRPEVTGTAEPGARVTVAWGDRSTSTTIADPIGHYTVEGSTVQPNGTVTAAATDINGNAGRSGTAPYTDTTAPSTTTIASFIDDVGSKQGSYPSATTTDDTAPVLTGRGRRRSRRTKRCGSPRSGNGCAPSPRSG